MNGPIPTTPQPPKCCCGGPWPGIAPQIGCPVHKPESYQLVDLKGRRIASGPLVHGKANATRCRWCSGVMFPVRSGAEGFVACTRCDAGDTTGEQLDLEIGDAA